MSYRSETAGIELHRQRFEEAKATLEEMAANKDLHIDFNNDNTQLENALTTFGFRKEELNGQASYWKGYLFAYIRDTKKGLEVLADQGYETNINRVWKPHLYQISPGQNVREWYNSFPKHALNGGVLGAWCGLALFLPTTMVMNKYFAIDFPVALVGGLIFGPTLGGIFGVILSELGEPLKGPAALRYIAKNSTYEAPPSRIKVPVVDEEFTDEKAEQEHKETLEALAINQQVQEEQKARLRK